MGDRWDRLYLLLFLWLSIAAFHLWPIFGYGLAGGIAQGLALLAGIAFVVYGDRNKTRLK